MEWLKKFSVFFLLMFGTITYGSGSSTWIYGSLEEISYIKNNSNKVETVFSLKLEKYYGLNPSEVINYMKFRVYTEGGSWDGVEYPLSVKFEKTLGEKVLIYLSKTSGKFYIEKVVNSPDLSLVRGMTGVETVDNYQLGLLAEQNAGKRKPAQIEKEESVILEDFGFFTFSLFLIIFGTSLYFVSRNKNYD